MVQNGDAYSTVLVAILCCNCMLEYNKAEALCDSEFKTNCFVLKLCIVNTYSISVEVDSGRISTEACSEATDL